VQFKQLFCTVLTVNPASLKEKVNCESRKQIDSAQEVSVCCTELTKE